MRADASWVSQILYSYPKPIMDAAKAEEIHFEQYGELDPDLEVRHESKLLEENMKYYITKEPNSKNSVIKGVFMTNATKFIAFVLCKIVLSSADLCIPYLISEFVKYIEEENPAEYKTPQWAFTIAMGILFLELFKQLFWETLVYYMILVGHRANHAL